jgi:hypothetical protein
MTQQVVLRETTTAKAKATETAGLWRIKLIAADVHGSSGYYPASVLERDGAKAFPAGTHIYLDHPTMEEEWQKPERSVRDLAGAMREAASFENDPEEGAGLYANVAFKESIREDVAFYAETAGMSIRAIGVTDESPSTGELIVTELVEGLSVDIVTHAGAGGKLVAMTEGARKGPEPATQLFELKESDKNGMNELFKAVNTLNETVTAMLAKVEEAKKAAPAKDDGLSAAQLIEKLDAADLPPASRKRLAESYKAGEDFEQAVKDEVEFVKQVRESATSQAEGTRGRVQKSSDTDANELAEAMKIIGWAA